MESAIDPLHALTDAVGLQRRWRDVYGQEHDVADESLRTILAALGHPAETDHQLRRSLADLLRQKEELPPMLVGDAGRPVRSPRRCERAEVTDSDGKTCSLAVEDGMPVAPEQPGYYDLELDGHALKLAVAPPHCPLPQTTQRRPWGVAVQIPSLRGASPRSFGNFGELAETVEALARRGADAVAINPVHALFPGHGRNFSPYSPSSRRFLNSAMGDPTLLELPQLPESDAPPLIDWESALPERLRQLRAIFANLTDAQRQQILDDPANGDKDLRRHAIFDALDCRFRPAGANGWQQWPAKYRDPDSAAVHRFAAEEADEVAFHIFAQWLARQSLATVQTKAKAKGMAIGLVGDLAVGVDPGGSDAWSMKDSVLRGLTIGAPPDPLGPLGQNWALTGFSPEGLRRSGYAPWIAMLRSAFQSCGGLRIDHAYGLARLWVIPERRNSADGAYLTYPFADLVRLATLEAHLADALVIAEDLGTSPPGFTEMITTHHMLGMRVLWFERAADHGFIGAHDYSPLSVAMTGTHDTSTVAGWWTGRDIEWAGRLGRLPMDISVEKAEEIRDWDRGLLWSTIGDGGPRPSPSHPQRVVDAAIEHVARSPSLLALVPIEDVIGLEEQPNLPGTTSEHPNWRQRIAGSLSDILDQEEPSARLASLSSIRSSVT